jgi:hypothetical protein
MEQSMAAMAIGSGAGMYCWYCGTKLPGAAAFCHRCGQSQAPDAAFDPTVRPPAPDGWSWQSNAPPAETPTDEADPTVEPPPVVLVEVAPFDAEGEPASSATGAAERRVTASSALPSRIAGLLALLCGVVVVAGSLGPWASGHNVPRGSIQFHGLDGEGRVTLWCGLAALVCVAGLLVSPRRGSLGVLAAGAFFLAALIGISDWSNIVEHFDGLRRFSESARLRTEIDWGLRAVTFGGLAGTFLAMVQAIQARRISTSPGGHDVPSSK